MNLKVTAHLIYLIACISGFFILAMSAQAAASDDLAKQIDKDLKTVERHIVTEPSKADTELEAVRNLFTQLQSEAPDNPKLTVFQQKIEKLDAKLAKRLGRDVKPVSSTPAKTASPPKPAVKEVEKKEMAPVQKKETGDKLPGGVTSRINKMEKGLEKVETNLSKGSTDRADFEFKQVIKIWDEINDKYGDQFQADHPDIVNIRTKMEEEQSKLNEALGQAAAAEQKAQQEKESAQALEQKWIDAFAPYIDYKSEKYLNIRVADLDEQQAARQIENFKAAQKLLAEYESVNFSAKKSMDLQNTENSIRSTIKILGDSYGKDEQEAGSAEWLNKLNAYLDYGSDKALIASATSNADEILARQKIYEEAKALFAEYKQVDFPKGKSFKLQQAEEELAKRLADFPEENKKSGAFLTEAAEKKMQQEEKYFAGNQEWRSDTKALPYSLSDDRLADLDQVIVMAASVLGENNSTIQDLRQRQAKISDENVERNKVRAERTFMIADKFKGSGASDIKDKADSLVKGKHPGAKVLRTTIITGDWKEETVEEWTDTTKTAVRWRTTRSVTAQVAAKIGAEVRLFTVYIAKNKQSDGSWGSLYGNLHSDKGDLMLEKNVNKDMP